MPPIVAPQDSRSVSADETLEEEKTDYQPKIATLEVDYEKREVGSELLFEGTSEKGPFDRLDPNPGFYEIVKTLVLSVTLLPIRLLIVATILGTFLLLSKLWAAINNERIFSRGALTFFIRVSSRSILFVCGFYWIEVYGDAKLKKGTPIIVSSHVSFWEILYFCSSALCPSYVFKNDCLTVPVIGEVALGALQGINVDNKNSSGGGSAPLIKRIEEMEEAGPESDYRPLLIFPEGTTGNGSSIISFRSGSFVPGAPVKPVLVSMPFKHFSPSYESIYTQVLVARSLCQFYNRMQVRYLEDYIPSEEEKNDPKLYAENVRNIIAYASNLPMCDASYADKRAFHKRLGARLANHRLGWLSNFIHVNPPVLEEESSMEKLVYQYRRPRRIIKAEKEDSSDDIDSLDMSTPLLA
mmetsp:Transcript_64682/g.95642  ORF Transcript_64682/g.95642 Transcript_64682/m.95642 type:complete len:411 (+) Transcript_64682:30-1262(+)